MTSIKNGDNTVKNTRKSKFNTEEERRRSLLESKRKWAQKKSTKNDVKSTPEMELFEIHETSDGKMTNIYRPKKDDEETFCQKLEVLKEKLSISEKEIQSMSQILLDKDKTIELLTKEISFLKQKLEQKKTYDHSKPPISIRRVEEESEHVSSEYLSSDEDKSVEEHEEYTEDDITIYKEKRKRCGKNFKHDLVIEKILADRNRETTD